MDINVEVVEHIHKNQIHLRKISPDDAEFLYNNLKDKSITQFLSLAPIKSLKRSKDMIERYIHYWKNYAQFNYVIETGKGDQKTRVGSISLWNISWINKRAEIGLWIIPEYWGEEIGRKAIQLVKIIAFIHLKLNRLQAHVRVNNQRSINLFEKCKFIREGRLSEYLNDSGKFVDSYVYSYLKKKYIKESHN
jgi:[ribosomal protein S5]-alanine N-acetyltransferase